MPRQNSITALKTSRNALNNTASANGLIPGEPYLITDEDRIAIATTTSAYSAFAKTGEITTDAGKLTSGTLSPARLPNFTGDASSSAGSSALTLATVNSNVGTFGSGSSVPVLTVDGKGRVTAVSTVAVTAGDMYRADNLSGLANPTTARANLGLPALSLANTFDPANGPTLAVIKTDGVMEIGKYLDWHLPGSTSDFDYRMTLVGGVMQMGGAVSTGNLTVSGNLNVTGVRSLYYDSSNGSSVISGDTGGWAMGYFFRGSSGTYRGGFGARGGADNLTYYYIGSYGSEEAIITPGSYAGFKTSLRATGWWGFKSGSATGPGVELGSVSGNAYAIGFDRDAGSYVPMKLDASSFRFGVGNVTIDNGLSVGTNINVGTNITAAGSPVPSIQQSRDNVTNIGYDYTVSQLMRWKNYGGGHVIFDASNGTSPSGASIDKSNAQIAWGANYPALMGWNGSNTYGVRVDSARVADSAGSAGNANTLGGASADVGASGSTIVKRDPNGYILAQYLNQSSPNGENAGIDQVITTNGSDGYLRKAGLAYFISTALNRDIVIGNGSGGSAVARFVSNSDTGNSASATLQAYSSSGGAMMSFHRAGVYAVNMGLDSDNVFRIGGWSAPANVLQLNMGGDLTLNGAVFTRNATNYIRDVYRANSDAVNLTASGVWSAAAPVALADAATIAVNMATFLNATVTLAGNRTLGTPSNAKPGQSGYIAVYQDGTGSRTLAYASGWKFAGGTVPTLTTTPNALDILHYEVVSASVVVVTGVLKDVK